LPGAENIVNKLGIRSSAVTVIVDGTAYDIQYSYRPLTGEAVVSMSVYLFADFN